MITFYSIFLIYGWLYEHFNIIFVEIGNLKSSFHYNIFMPPCNRCANWMNFAGFVMSQNFESAVHTKNWKQATKKLVTPLISLSTYRMWFIFIHVSIHLMPIVRNHTLPSFSVYYGKGRWVYHNEWNLQYKLDLHIQSLQQSSWLLKHHISET